jgi:O-glycosyl hydrolase
VDLAALWAPPEPQQPGAYAFRIYRNYDGQGGSFGETSVKATSSDQGVLAVYAAERADGAVTVVVINKSTRDLASTLSVTGAKGSTATVYRYSNANLQAIEQVGNASLNAGSLTATFPQSSITLFVIK